MIDLPPGTRAHTLPEAGNTPSRYAPDQISAWPNLKGALGGIVRADLVPGHDARTADSFYVTGYSEGWFAVRNPYHHLTWGMKFDAELFPYLWIWQVYGGHWGYPYYGRTDTLAIEPFTSPIQTLTECADDGTAVRLDPGGSLETSFQAMIGPDGSFAK